MINRQLTKTPYEIWTGRKPKVGYFKIFGCKCFIHNNGKDNLKAFDAKADEGIFLGYSAESKAYRILNKRTMVTEESIHVVFDEPNVNGEDIEESADKLNHPTIQKSPYAEAEAGIINSEEDEIAESQK